MDHCWLQSTLLLASLLVLTGNCANLRVQQPFKSKKSPSETINVYETVTPVVVHNDNQTPLLQNHHKETLVILHMEKETYSLELQLNEFLLSPNFVSGYDIDGVKVEEKHDNCFYHGTVTGHPEWQVAVSTCYGLRGWFGDLNNPSNLYHIEPIEDTTSLTDPHAVYMDSQHQNSDLGTCGTGKQHKIKSVPDPAVLDSMPNQHMLKKRQSGQTLIVEWLLVNDYYQYINYNRNISAVALRAIEIANQVDLLYQPLNVRVVLVHSLTWTTQQEIQDTQDSDTILDLFQIYHRTNTEFRDIVHDSAMMITGIDINGPTVGVAYLNRMCVYDESVGFTMDGQGSIQGVGSIAAHELGHIFNMDHDDSAGCQCPDGDSKCIMAATISFPPPQMFSQCSRIQLTEGLENFGRGVCLTNNPTTIFGDPACGNGIKEPGEICDCGTVDECRDPCCNATTCTLSEGSQCGEGPCCQNCQFRDYGTPCRESRGVCGIEEYCTGESAECPRDVYLQNGSPCEGNTAFCYDGLCASLTSQCNVYYGEESVPSNDECYNQLNVQGVGFGHCGAKNAAFVACAAEDVKCGSIQCSGGNIIFNNIDYSGTLTYSTRSVSYEGSFYTCKTFTTSATSDEISPGIVLEGTKCGNESLCLSQQCVSISSLGLTPCPVGSNGEVCSGKGVCNNLDECSCNVDSAGSDCSEKADMPSRRNNGDVTKTAMSAVTIVTTTTPIGTSRTTTTTTRPVRRTSDKPRPTRPHPRPTPPSTTCTEHSSESTISSSANYIKAYQTTSTIRTVPPTNSPISPPANNNNNINVNNNDDDIFSQDLAELLETNPGVIAGSVVVVLVVLVALVVAIVIVALFIIMRTKKNRTFSPSRSRPPRTYVSKTTSDGRTKPGIHGSTDDLLMTGVSPSGSSPIPPPSGGPASYKPYAPSYAPPPYTSSPMVAVNQDVRRSPPNKPKPRPPPPSRTPPAVRVVDKPSPAVTRPPPPTKKPLSVNKPNQSTKPSTAPKPPNKVAGKWPPPSAQESNTTKPSVPMKPPMFPRKQ